MTHAQWNNLVSRDHTGRMRRVDELIKTLCMEIPCSGSGDWQRRMHQLGRRPEVRSLAMLGSHIPKSLKFPIDGTEMDIIIWTHQRGAITVGQALLAS